MCCLFPRVLQPQGVNIEKPDEFKAIGDMLTQAQWQLPMAEEYKNDLVLPSFLDVEAVPKSSGQQLMLTDARRPQADDPATSDQWAKVNKMVAFVSKFFNFFFALIKLLESSKF